MTVFTFYACVYKHVVFTIIKRKYRLEKGQELYKRFHYLAMMKLVARKKKKKKKTWTSNMWAGHELRCPY